jgi:hypothetical protein
MYSTDGSFLSHLKHVRALSDKTLLLLFQIVLKNLVHWTPVQPSFFNINRFLFQVLQATKYTSSQEYHDHESGGLWIRITRHWGHCIRQRPPDWENCNNKFPLLKIWNLLSFISKVWMGWFLKLLLLWSLASRFRERQTAGSNFLGRKIFVERFRFIFFFLVSKE